MKSLVLVSICLALFILASCGSDGSTGSTSLTSGKQAESASDSVRPPRVRVPPGPPPKRLIVRDIRRGSGAAIPPNKHVQVNTNFVAVSYRTGKTYEVRWQPKGSFSIGFGPGLEIKGWEKGLVGMRVGGRRELVVPSELAYGQGALVYVVDLLGVE